MKKFNPHSLITLIRQYYAFLYTQKYFEERTKINHLSRINQIFAYLAEIKNPQLDIREIDVDFVRGYLEYASQLYQLTNNARNVELIKSTLDFAVTKRLIDINPIATVITGRTPVKDVVSVTEDELDSIFNYSPIGERKTEKKKCAILYTLQSETGMSYGDLKKFKVIEDSGVMWLYNTRIKGRNKKKRDYWVPLTDRALSIINKGKLPELSNLQYNTNIKRVARDLRINKRLTTHTARKTFATRMYDKGWSLESIADMMGITIQVLTTHYIRKSKNRIANELSQRLSSIY